MRRSFSKESQRTGSTHLNYMMPRRELKNLRRTSCFRRADSALLPHPTLLRFRCYSKRCQLQYKNTWSLANIAVKHPPQLHLNLSTFNKHCTLYPNLLARMPAQTTQKAQPWKAYVHTETNNCAKTKGYEYPEGEGEIIMLLRTDALPNVCCKKEKKTEEEK